MQTELRISALQREIESEVATALREAEIRHADAIKKLSESYEQRIRDQTEVLVMSEEKAARREKAFSDKWQETINRHQDEVSFLMSSHDQHVAELLQEIERIKAQSAIEALRLQSEAERKYSALQFQLDAAEAKRSESEKRLMAQIEQQTTTFNLNTAAFEEAHQLKIRAIQAEYEDQILALKSASAAHSDNAVATERVYHASVHEAEDRCRDALRQLQEAKESARA